MTTSSKNRKKVRVNSNQLVLGLSALLTGQLILTSAIFMSKHPQNNKQAPLLSFDPKKVSNIIIEENSKGGKDRELKRLDLVMTDKADWRITSLEDFPASSDLIHQTLDSIVEIKKGAPVGTTTDAQERNRVSSANFFRAISLFAGDALLGQIYIGNTLADKTTTFRSADDSSVYADTLSASRFTTNPNYWIDTRAASVKLKKIESIDMGYFRLDNLDESWNLVEGDRADLLNSEAVLGLVYPVANCKIIYVLGTQAEPDYDLDHPFLTFKVTLKDGLKRIYKVSKAKKSGYYILNISGFPWICVADKRTIDKIIAWNPESLRKQQNLASTKPRGVDLKGMLKRKMDETLQSVSHDIDRSK